MKKELGGFEFGSGQSRRQAQNVPANLNVVILANKEDVIVIAENMASCYGGNRNSGNTGKLNVHEKCAYLPLVREIDYNGERVNVTINSFDDQDCYQQGYELMNEVIEEGKTWPFLEPFEHIDDYCGEGIVVHILYRNMQHLFQSFHLSCLLSKRTIIRMHRLL